MKSDMQILRFYLVGQICSAATPSEATSWHDPGAINVQYHKTGRLLVLYFQVAI